MSDTLQWVALVGLAAAIVALGFALLSLRRLLLLLTDEGRIALIARRNDPANAAKRVAEALNRAAARAQAAVRSGRNG